jgi:acetylornithine deacetylase
VSKFAIANELSGKLELTWGEHDMTGIACSLESPGFHSLCAALTAVRGEAKPYSICGSLPLVDELQANGFDVQLVGFGLSAAYHADNEYCLLGDMKDGFQVLARMVHGIENSS